ncbi:hypothetical protein IDH20_04250 [Pelagibacterales bacterium SAG-MED39]|nr:hypothetical protein [Pelagibacterales bacterium SAG-MED39]
MIEILYIILQVLIFLILFSSIPINKIIKVSNSKYPSLSENIAFNFVLHSNFILILCILNLDINKISIIYLTSIPLIYIFFLRNNFQNIKIFKKNSFYEFMLIFLVSLFIFIDMSNKLILSWDAEKFWLSKSLNFYNEFTIENLKNISRPHYPFLGPLISSLYWKLSFINEEYSRRLIFGFIYCSSVLLLINNLELSKLYKIIFFSLLLLVTYDYFLILSGNQEILIFSIICIVMNSFYKIKNNKNENLLLHLIIIILSCNLLMWIKQEGIFYSFFLIFTLFFIIKLTYKQKLLYLSIILGFFIFKLLIFKLYNLEISLNKSVVSSLALNDLFLKITFDRFLLVLKYFFFAPFQSYFLLLGIILYFLNKIGKTKINYLNFYILINFLFIFIVYLLIDNQEYNLKTGIDRLIFNVSPLIIILLVEIINKKIKNYFL